MSSNEIETKHWFIRFLPLIVVAAMIAIPTTSIYLHILFQDYTQAKVQGTRDLLTGAVDEIDLDSLIRDISRGDWTRVPSEWRDVAREALGQDGARMIRQSLQDSPPTEGEIKKVLKQVIGE